MLKRVEKDEEIKPIFQKEIEGNKDGENKDKKMMKKKKMN